jgi:sugar lactone lactonase YvrE
MRTLSALLLAALLVLPGTASAAPALYWIDTNFAAPTLNRSDPDGLNISTVPLSAGTLPEGLAVDDGGLLYWAEAPWYGARVMHATTALSGITQLVGGGSVYRGIALDDVANFVYFTSSNIASGASIQRASVLGGPVTTLISLGPLANPRGIAIDHNAGKMYWADFGGAIYRANLDGSGMVMLFSLPGAGPYGVAVDPVGQLLYWTEYNSGLLRRAPTFGPPIINIQINLANPTYLTLDLAGGRMYWTEGGVGAQKLVRSMTNGLLMTTLPPPLTTYGGLAFSGGTPLPVVYPDLPTEFAIDRVWPSPARGPVRVLFSLPREARARLTVIDLQGREVAVLADGVLPAGRHEQLWNGRSGGGAAAAGVYFVRLAAERRTWVRRVVIGG